MLCVCVFCVCLYLFIYLSACEVLSVFSCLSICLSACVRVSRSAVSLFYDILLIFASPRRLSLHSSPMSPSPCPACFLSIPTRQPRPPLPAHPLTSTSRPGSHDRALCILEPRDKFRKAPPDGVGGTFIFLILVGENRDLGGCICIGISRRFAHSLFFLLSLFLSLCLLLSLSRALSLSDRKQTAAPKFYSLRSRVCLGRVHNLADGYLHS